MNIEVSIKVVWEWFVSSSQSQQSATNRIWQTTTKSDQDLVTKSTVINVFWIKRIVTGEYVNDRQQAQDITIRRASCNLTGDGQAAEFSANVLPHVGSSCMTLLMSVTWLESHCLYMLIRKRIWKFVTPTPKKQLDWLEWLRLTFARVSDWRPQSGQSLPTAAVVVYFHSEIINISRLR